MNKKTLGLGIFSIAFGTVLFILSTGIKDFAAVGVGAKFFPRLAATGFILLGILLLLELRQVVVNTASPSEPAPKSTRFHLNPALYSMGLLVAYVALLEPVGYIISSTLYIFFQIQILHRGNKHHYVRYAIISIISAIITYLLFVRVFGVMIPAGLLG